MSKRFRLNVDIPSEAESPNFTIIPFQGLRIAPPEAPVTGYMFGKGIYFADMVSKSANYCNTTR